MTGRSILLFLLLALAVPAGQATAGNLVVVVNARSGVTSLTRNDVINIFLGRYRRLPGGLMAEPVDQPANLPDRARFYHLLVDKDLSEINAYWTRLVFSGKTNPPYQAEDIKDVLDWLARNQGAIGYLDRSLVDARFKVVFDLGQ